MATKKVLRWTLVQHSAYGYNQDLRFQRAVEERSVEGVALKRVRHVGGVLLPSYTAASDMAEEENYPASVSGLIPRVDGTFAKEKVDGLRIYIPVKKKT